MPDFIGYHMDLKQFTTPELKKVLREKKYLNVWSYSRIQDELLRRGEGYYRD
ncbi:MAG: hypothetical protein KAW41_01960 [Candidatus Diapherotrites archaeon]|nr:hypothetical protein [Candidatus Diapherotrites archaeon]